MANPRRPRLGLALGGGAARGWAHIGIIRGLARAGHIPDLVCGTSIGALVGAAYVGGELARLESWVRELKGWDIVSFLDLNLSGGGLISGQKLMSFFEQEFPHTEIEQFDRPYAAVATDLLSGREVWLQSGSALKAVRASIALPGLFTPVHHGDSLLADGGLVNPVPVSVCRALGAERVVAVDLTGDRVGRHFIVEENGRGSGIEIVDALWARISRSLREKEKAEEDASQALEPSMFAVLTGTIHIMQDRITRSRLAGDPPDVLLTPQLGNVGLMEFDRAEETIAEGEACVQRMLPAIEDALGR